MLTKGDDFPLHQTPEPIAYTGGNRNFYDRYFFNGYNRNGDLFFAAALGVYPYVNIMDAAFSVVTDGVQRNVYASKVMHMERLDTEVGPVKVKVKEPLEVLQVIVDEPDEDIRAELTFTCRTPAHEEPRFLWRIGSQTTMDYTRLTQNGVWAGWMEIKGKRYEVTPEDYWGTRDRSWGLRNIGAPDAQPNPEAKEFQFYWLWAPLNFDNFATHYFTNDDAEGEDWNSNGLVIPLVDGEAASKVKRWWSELKFKSGTRHAEKADIYYEMADGSTWHFALEPKWNFYMKGIGYGHPEFKHGSYHGEFKKGYDEFKLSEVDPTNLHIQAMCDVTLTTPDGVKQGQGILEQLFIGPHAPSGFKDMMDMAP